MLAAVTGPFHPELESALAQEVRALKAEDPWAPLLLIVPSDVLRRRLKHLLCLEHRLALVQVEVLTFHQLALRLLEETGQEGLALRSSDPLFPEFIRALLVRQTERDPAWSGLVPMPGAWHALWATLKDLKDAGIQADDVMEAVDQTPGDLAGILTEPPIRRLFGFYKGFLEGLAHVRVCDFDDLAARAATRVAESSFLGRQRRIFYYGFYDLTQCQLDLFQAIARTSPTSLFFPLIFRHPGFRFAEQFFDRYIRGLVDDIRELDSQASRSWLMHLFAPETGSSIEPELTPTLSGGTRSPAGPECRMIQVSGKEDEVSVIAKEILMLVEERGYGFHEIGVVGRTLSGYEEILPRVFDDQGIPFVSTLTRSLAGFPYVKTALQLLGLRESQYRRDLVIDLVRSPFFSRPALGRELGVARSAMDRAWRPDLWDLASRRLGIVKTVDEWQRLEAYEAHGLPLTTLEKDKDEASGPCIPGAVIRSLRLTVRGLSDALDRIPEVGTWSMFVRYAETLCQQWLTPVFEDESGDHASGHRTSELPHGSDVRADLQGVADAFHDRLRALCHLDRLEESVRFTDFVATLGREMEQGTVPVHPAGGSMGSRVQVLDAMAARGLPFRALFVLGLNEGVFPRHIREDAFLHDRVRRVLERDLGYKIPEKLGGYDEEKLLLTMLVHAATDMLVCLAQRSDEGGRPLVPSVYVDELRRAREQVGLGSERRVQAVNLANDPRDLRVPRRWRDKVSALPHYQGERLTPAELIRHMLLERRDPRPLLHERWSSESTVLAERGLAALRSLETSVPRLGAYDGITGPLDTFWATMKARGLSPTSLQRYAECPFQYFAARVLQLDPLPASDDIEDVGPADLGSLVHDILAGCLQTLRERGYFRRDSARRPALDPLAVLEEVGWPILQVFAQSHPVGYPLVWEVQQERLLASLARFLQADLVRLEDGWEPVLFETPVKGELTVTLPHGHETFPLVGRLDRVDWSAASHSYRIIDYKVRMGRGPAGLDRNLELGAIRGIRLQPPLYLRAAQTMIPEWFRENESSDAEGLEASLEDCPVPACEGVWFYYLVQGLEHMPADQGKDDDLVPVQFPGDAWSRLETALEDPLARILGNIHQGLFFINPGRHCARCSYAPLCRKTHQPTAWRARVDLRCLGPYQAMHRARVPTSGSDPMGSPVDRVEASDA